MELAGFYGGLGVFERKPGIHIAWKTVTYRSVALLVLAGLLVFLVGMRFAFPQFTDNEIKAADGFGMKMLEAVAGAAGPAKSGVMNSQQAHFTALDGTVRVKKATSSSWTKADYSLPLEKGDVVQTSSEGMAKIVFNDGTNYTVKQDSLIVIEENSANDQQQTNVAVAVSTGHGGPGDRDLCARVEVREVIVAGATASLAPESAAMVHNDPKSDEHEILVKKGTGDIERNGETVRLADWEKVNFQAQETHMEKGKEIGPPTPISPANMAPIFLSGEPKPVEFSWTPMANAKGYRLRISKNPYFSSTIVDRRVNTADVLVSGLQQGAYYWMVQSQDAVGKESVESEKNRFTLIPKGQDTEAISLDLDPLDPAWARSGIDRKDGSGCAGDGERGGSPDDVG